MGREKREDTGGSRTDRSLKSSKTQQHSSTLFTPEPRPAPKKLGRATTFATMLRPRPTAKSLAAQVFKSTAHLKPAAAAGPSKSLKSSPKIPSSTKFAKLQHAQHSRSGSFNQAPLPTYSLLKQQQKPAPSSMKSEVSHHLKQLEKKRKGELTVRKTLTAQPLFTPERTRYSTKFPKSAQKTPKQLPQAPPPGEGKSPVLDGLIHSLQKVERREFARTTPVSRTPTKSPVVARTPVEKPSGSSIYIEAEGEGEGESSVEEAPRKTAPPAMPSSGGGDYFAGGSSYFQDEVPSSRDMSNEAILSSIQQNQAKQMADEREHVIVDTRNDFIALEEDVKRQTYKVEEDEVIEQATEENMEDSDCDEEERKHRHRLLFASPSNYSDDDEEELKDARHGHGHSHSHPAPAPAPPPPPKFSLGNRLSLCQELPEEEQETPHPITSRIDIHAEEGAEAEGGEAEAVLTPDSGGVGGAWEIHE